LVPLVALRSLAHFAIGLATNTNVTPSSRTDFSMFCDSRSSSDYGAIDPC